MRKGIDHIGVSAGAFIVNEYGEIFLAKRSLNARNEQGHWEAQGGSVEFGETLEAAVRREIREEFGAEIEIIEQWPAANNIIKQDKTHWVSTTFLARFQPRSVPRILEPEKCEEIGWFPLNALPAPLSLITTIGLERYQKDRPE